MSINKDTKMEESSCEQFRIDKEPIEYFVRFSLCVLDIVRKLQKHRAFEKGVEKCHIIEYLKHQSFIDGDVASQVSTALRELENNGYLMYMKNGYKTLGPFAKLNTTRTQKQRRLIWRKLEMKFSHSNTDIMLPLFISKRNRKIKSESDFRNNGSHTTLNSHENEEC